jgi:hypothetical protein
LVWFDEQQCPARMKLYRNFSELISANVTPSFVVSDVLETYILCLSKIQSVGSGNTNDTYQTH